MGKKQPLPPVVVYVQQKSPDTRAVDEAFNYLFNKFIQQQKNLTKE